MGKPVRITGGFVWRQQKKRFLRDEAELKAKTLPERKYYDSNIMETGAEIAL